MAFPPLVAESTLQRPLAKLKAQREGNWALYGEEIERLGEMIGKMR